MSARAQSFWSLAIAVTLTRGLGQSALSVISLAMVGQWFVRGIDTAMAIYSIVMSIGFMIAFPVVGIARAVARLAIGLVRDRRGVARRLAPVSSAARAKAPEHPSTPMHRCAPPVH